MKRAVVFDFDGTIVDSLKAVIKVFEDVTKRPHRFTPEEIEELQHKDPLQIALELNVPKWKIPWLLVKGRRMFRDHMRSMTVHIGMPEVIRTLHESGVPLYVLSSNSKSNVQKYLRWNDLNGYFTNVYGNAGLLGKTRKLHILFKNEKLDPTTSWYIGDETRDIIGAHGAGLKVIAVSWGYNSRTALADKKPDALVDTPSEILTILNKKA
jgi:phosphoglycolate phosphatase-like HAD superfamily hydrolase